MIPGQGMPSQRHHEPGDLFVKISIKFPENLDPAAYPLLEKALPPRAPIEPFDKNIVLDEVEMEAADARHGPGSGGRDEPMDEDGEEPRVQCANQ